MNKKSAYNPIKLRGVPRLKQQSRQSSKVSVGQLRKIQPEDMFPCFSCFDQSALRVSCLACNKLGYVKGDHPMVRFADDFLTKNLLNYMQGQGDDEDQQKSQGNQYNTFVNVSGTRKQCRSALESYTSKQPETEIQSKLMKSSNPTTIQQIHYDYACNYCDCSPIKGIRYHCEQCKDFDLCETCYLTIRNKQLDLEEHKSHHKVRRITKKVKPEEVIEQLIKCERSSLTRSKGQK